MWTSEGINPTAKNKMNINTPDTVSLDEAFAQIDARRRAENPWTPADEARADARRAIERARHEAWAIANPAGNEDEDEDEDEGNEEGNE